MPNQRARLMDVANEHEYPKRLISYRNYQAQQRLAKQKRGGRALEIGGAFAWSSSSSSREQNKAERRSFADQGQSAKDERARLGRTAWQGTGPFPSQVDPPSFEKLPMPPLWYSRMFEEGRKFVPNDENWRTAFEERKARRESEHIYRTYVDYLTNTKSKVSP